MGFLYNLSVGIGDLTIKLIFVVLWVIIATGILKIGFIKALLSDLIGFGISYITELIVSTVLKFDEQTTFIYGILAFVVGCIIGLFFPIIKDMD